jgi:IclR family transcriptional regulator, acetate operon repressor
MTEHIVQDAEQFGADTSTPLPAQAPMVERAFRVLDALGAADESLSLSELARALGMSKGSMHGLLKTLESADVVEQCDDRRYALGPRLYDLAQAYARRAGLRRFALPAMERLAESLGETILLGQIEQDAVRIVERVEARGEHTALRISAERGTRVPLLAAATGRVVLASWPLARREDYLRTHPLPRFTAHAPADAAAYLAAVAETERTGIGIDREQYLIGVNAVAAPVRGAGDTLLAVLWAVGFSARFGGNALERASQEVRAEADAISRALGGQPKVE